MKPWIALYLCVLALVGCGGERSIALTDWDQGGRAVRLPAHLDVPRGPYELTTRVEVPSELRGAFTALTVRALFANASLEVDGIEVPRQGAEGGRAVLSHRWILPPSPAAQRTLVLRVAHAGPREAWFDSAPRLSRDPRGDATFIAVERFNRIAGTFGFGVLSVVGFAYFALYWLDRRRRSFGWFALQGFGAVVMSLHLMGYSERWLGSLDLAVFHVSVLVADFGGFCFVREHFEIDRPHRGWRIVLGLTAALVLAVPGERWLARIEPLFIAVTGGFLFAQVIALGRAARLHHRRNEALLLAVAYVATAVLLAPEFGRVLGQGDPTGGLALVVPALAMFAVCQAALLGRAHVQSLQMTESLNAELESRVDQLEARQTEIDRLNTELRRQIAERSRELSAALARLGEIDDRGVKLRVGDVIEGRYRVLAMLGEGGMGTVYEVERIADAKRCALKVMQRARTGAALARFAREAQLAARISHRNLVSILDVDVTTSGTLFLVMELVDGGTLEDLRDRYGDVPRMMPVLRDVAEGMMALHRNGVIHRDLKPGNILIDKGGTAKIADFGVATVGPDLERTQHALTGTGSVLGTPHYMAPELTRGPSAVSAAVDVFAFGVMAYEVLGGVAPFKVPPVLDVMSGRSLPKPATLAIASAAIADVIERALSAEPSLRPTAEEVATAFRS
jgi:predicted Ser/Thr protein kinase